MSAWDILREFLFALGCAVATLTLLGLGLTLAVVIERLVVARRRKPEPRWLGDCRSVEDIALADLRRHYEGNRRLVVGDELEALWSLPEWEGER